MSPAILQPTPPPAASNIACPDTSSAAGPSALRNLAKNGRGARGEAQILLVLESLICDDKRPLRACGQAKALELARRQRGGSERSGCAVPPLRGGAEA